MSNHELKPLIEISGTNGKLQLYENFLRLNRNTFLGFMNQGLKGNKDLYFKSITAIQLKKPGLFAGYIQFSLLGGNESKGAIFSAVRDENSVTFSSASSYEKALEIKEYIESKINSSDTGKNNNSNADEIEKLHSLMEKGILTKKEFEQKKNDLLGMGKTAFTSDSISHKENNKSSIKIGESIDGISKKREFNSSVVTSFPVKGQQFLSIFLIVFGFLIVWTTVFGGLLNIAFGIFFLPSVMRRISWYSRISGKQIYIGSFILFIVGFICVGLSANESIENKEVVVIHPMNIEVSSQIIKQIGDKCRYFFDIRNKDQNPFEGSVKIELVNDYGWSVMGDTFTTTTPINSNLGTSQFIDASTCPKAIHGESGITKFSYKVMSNNEIVKIGSGYINDKLEDLR